jgi:hypothetical protein
MQGVIHNIQFRRKRQLDDEDMFELAIKGLLLLIQSSTVKVCIVVNK